MVRARRLLGLQDNVEPQHLSLLGRDVLTLRRTELLLRMAAEAQGVSLSRAARPRRRRGIAGQASSMERACSFGRFLPKDARPR